jgi:hypothetical protein
MEYAVKMLVPSLAIICIFGLPVLAVAFVIVKLITSNNRERLELARHGIVPPVQAKPSPNKYRSLRNGILCIGIAVGLIAGLFIVGSLSVGVFAVSDDIALYTMPDRMQAEFLILCASTVMCLGLSYIVFYLIVKDKRMENEAE